MSVLPAERFAAEPRLQGELSVGDMREWCREGAFDLVANIYTSFGFFTDIDEDRRELNDADSGEVSVYGGFDGRPYDQTAVRLVVVPRGGLVTERKGDSNQHLFVAATKAADGRTLIRNASALTPALAISACTVPPDGHEFIEPPEGTEEVEHRQTKTSPPDRSVPSPTRTAPRRIR